MYYVSETAMIEAVAAYEAAMGDKAAAAKALGVGPDTLQKRLKAAERKGLTGNAMGGPALEGYHFGKITTLVGKNGEMMQWQHQHPDDENLEEFVKLVKEEMSVLPTYAPAPPIDYAQEGRGWSAFFPIVDHHFGMYAWAKETGQNYDLEIAERVLLGTASRLVMEAPLAEQATLLGLGDFFHMDNYENRTEKNRHPLDADGRYPKVLQLGVRQWKVMIRDALAKYPLVKVRILRGNHDEKGAVVLAVALAEAFSEEPRVTVDLDPSLMWFDEWGLNMFGAHHGHTIKPEKFPSKMAAIKPEIWGRTQYRYAWSGHLHRSEKGPRGLEDNGATYEIFEASTARDAWNAEQGFTSNRSMHWRAYHKDGAFKTGGVYIKGEWI